MEMISGLRTIPEALKCCFVVHRPCACWARRRVGRRCLQLNSCNLGRRNCRIWRKLFHLALLRGKSDHRPLNWRACQVSDSCRWGGWHWIWLPWAGPTLDRRWRVLRAQSLWKKKIGGMKAKAEEWGYRVCSRRGSSWLVSNTRDNQKR